MLSVAVCRIVLISGTVVLINLLPFFVHTLAIGLDQ